MNKLLVLSKNHSSTTNQFNPHPHHVMCFLLNRTFCCLLQCCFLSFEEQKNRGSSSCCFVNLAWLVQSVVCDPRRWSNRELNLVLHFHVSRSRLWYTIWTFRSMPCRCCAVNMWTHSLHAFVQHPLSQSAMARLWLGPAFTHDSCFVDCNQVFFFLIWPCKS